MNEDFLISYLKEKNGVKEEINLPKDKQIRALMNITMPYSLSEEFYQKQDEYLSDRLKGVKITDVNGLPFTEDKISLFLGDITTVKADAIVNACNEKLLGCFSPLHGCIDNAIHSFAGLQVRRDLLEVMQKQGYDEPSGRAKITSAYNLPSKYILHTVGPIVYGGNVTEQNKADLYNCYISCLRLAEEKELKNVVFCSLSTGVYGYPVKEAAKVAIRAVKDYLSSPTKIEMVVFNLFIKQDYDVYYSYLKGDKNV